MKNYPPRLIVRIYDQVAKILIQDLSIHHKLAMVNYQISDYLTKVLIRFRVTLQLMGVEVIEV